MRIAYDAELMRPGCAIVQAAYGGDLESCNAFPTASWLLAPTPQMRVYETTPEQMEVLVRRTCERMET